MAEDEWSECKAPDGRIFYHNRVTKQSVWKRPDELQSPAEKLPSEGMETEDSSEEEEDFQLVVNSKRRKTAGAIVVDGQDEQNLLNRNKFSPLVENNNNNNNSSSVENNNNANPVAPVTVQRAGERRQPPLVVKNTRITDLRQVMKSCAVKPIYKLTQFGIKIICASAMRFDIVQEHLIRNSVEFYTHEKRSERPYRVVIRSLPPWEPKFVKKGPQR